jgi:hypothetical protein
LLSNVTVGNDNLLLNNKLIKYKVI